MLAAGKADMTFFDIEHPASDCDSVSKLMATDVTEVFEAASGHDTASVASKGSSSSIGTDFGIGAGTDSGVDSSMDAAALPVPATFFDIFDDRCEAGLGC